MGRPERSVDADSGPVARFACDLRALRKAAGSPSYRSLAARANYSATMLSRAASGRELASLPVVLAYVSACGGDCDEWRARWLGLAAELNTKQPGLSTSAVGGEAEGAGAARSAGNSADTAEPGPRSPADRLTRRLVRRILAPRTLGSRSLGSRRVVVVALSLVIALAAAGVAAALTGSDSPAPAGRHRGARLAGAMRSSPVNVPAPAALSDGNDPKESGCGPDAVTVAHAELRLDRTVTVAAVLRKAGTDVGLIELRYSPHCHAAWARATPAPAFNIASLGWVTIAVSRPADGTNASFRVAVMTIVYGDILLTNGGCLTASAQFRFRGGGAANATTPCWRHR